MSTFKSPFKALALLAILVSSLIPLGASTASAQSREDWEEYYKEYQEYQSRGGSRSWSSRSTVQTTTSSSKSSSRERVSSAAQKAIDKLDDDIVEDIPIPVLLGITLKSISPNFGDPRDGGARSHEGEDILAPRGTPLASPTDAVVTKTGNGSSSGLYVTTRNPGGESFTYMHLDEVAEGIKSGTVLEPGDILGFVGDTGNAKGGVTHVHFEIRENRKALDPFPRLAREFTLKERMSGIEKYLKELDNDDAEEWAEELVTAYRSTFVQAKLASIDLPEEIEDALGSVPVATTGGAASGIRDLTLGSTGDDVTALQVTLIAADSGSAAKALASSGATGYFGALTQAALAEYQKANGISPATGYYGALTRAYILAHSK